MESKTYDTTVKKAVINWEKPHYQKRAISKEETIEKAKLMKRHFKFFEVTLVFNLGFFVASVAFMILFRFERDVVLFTLWLLGIVLLNIYGYCYTKKELTRLTKNIEKRG